MLWKNYSHDPDFGDSSPLWLESPRHLLGELGGLKSSLGVNSDHNPHVECVFNDTLSAVS